MTFEEPRSHFCQLYGYGQLQPDFAADTMTGKIGGYRACLVSVEKAGEVESLFLGSAFRSDVTGTAMVPQRITWIDSPVAVRKRVSVGDGNEAARAFYRKSGFCPRVTVLEQIPDPY